MIHLWEGSFRPDATAFIMERLRRLRISSSSASRLHHQPSIMAGKTDRQILASRRGFKPVDAFRSLVFDADPSVSSFLSFFQHFSGLRRVSVLRLQTNEALSPACYSLGPPSVVSLFR